MRPIAQAAALIFALGLCGGCFQMTVDANLPPAERERVDSTHVPATRNHEEAKQELEKAYRYIRRLENNNAELKKDKRELKAEKEKYEELYKKAKKASKHDD